MQRRSDGRRHRGPRLRHGAATRHHEPLEACLQSRHICGDSPKSTYREMCEERARAAYANQPDAEAREAWLARRGCYLPQRTIASQ